MAFIVDMHKRIICNVFIIKCIWKVQELYIKYIEVQKRTQNIMNMSLPNQT